MTPALISTSDVFCRFSNRLSFSGLLDDSVDGTLLSVDDPVDDGGLQLTIQLTIAFQMNAVIDYNPNPDDSTIPSDQGGHLNGTPEEDTERRSCR